MNNAPNFTVVNPKPQKKRRSGGGGLSGKVVAILIGIGVLIVALFLIAFPPFVTVPTGHTGVVLTFGRVEDFTFGEGFHGKNPIQQVVMMDTRTQKQTLTLQAFSSDIQQVDVIASVNFAVDDATVQKLYQTVGRNYYATVMEPRIQENIKAVFAQYSAEKLVQVRATLSSQVMELLVPEMQRYGITINSIAIENVDFTDAFTNAVEDKQVAEQTKLRVETEQAQQVSVEKSAAERRIISANADAQERAILAQADADVAKIKADAEAYAREVQAKAEAEANQKLAASITKDLIEYMKINQWDGALPKFQAGESGVMPIIDMGGSDSNAN